MKRPLALACAGLAIAAGVATLTANFATAQQTPPSAEPLELFAKMMPVFGHARCTNCHGGMDPSGRHSTALFPVAHPAGAVTSVGECRDCHNATEAIKDTWRAASHGDLRFFGKDAKQMCDMQSTKVQASTRDDYLRHIQNDTLILAGFDGMAGGARDPDPPRQAAGGPR